jgi:hypothetical protein
MVYLISSFFVGAAVLMGAILRFFCRVLFYMGFKALIFFGDKTKLYFVTIPSTLAISPKMVQVNLPVPYPGGAKKLVNR